MPDERLQHKDHVIRPELASVALTREGHAVVDELRASLSQTLDLLDRLVSNSAEKTLAVRKAQELSMWLSKAAAMDPRYRQQ